MSQDTCCTSDKNCIILACSGSSNVGQLANLAAIKLAQEGLGHFGCLSGVAAGFDGFVQSAKDADEVLLIDGCPKGCAKGIFENQGIPLKKYVVVTELGIQKVHKFDLANQDIEKVTTALRDMLSDSANTVHKSIMEESL